MEEGLLDEVASHPMDATTAGAEGSAFDPRPVGLEVVSAAARHH